MRAESTTNASLKDRIKASERLEWREIRDLGKEAAELELHLLRCDDLKKLAVAYCDFPTIQQTKKKLGFLKARLCEIRSTLSHQEKVLEEMEAILQEEIRVLERRKHQALIEHDYEAASKASNRMLAFLSEYAVVEQTSRACRTFKTKTDLANCGCNVHNI
jgi:uncharacterized coiled-coil protein SlyX